MKSISITLPSAVLSLALLLSACGQTDNAADPSSVPTSSPSEAVQASSDPDSEPSSSGEEAVQGLLSSFSAQDLDGNSVDQSILEGHTLTMVNVWATFCTPCINEMPDLGELAEEYSDQGVQIVGLISDVLDRDGTPSETQLDTAREIVSATGADYLHIVPSADLYGILAQITSVPTTFFVDETGAQVGYAYLGAMDKDQWSAILDEMLAGDEQ